jgi:putative ABC transport system ATP-binding protein
VFQAFHVLPHLTVAENVSLPLRLLGRADEGRVAAMLDAVGLAGLGGRHPAQLSGGQLQRVAIARAVVHAPGLILADEPTGNLDPVTAERVLAVLREQVHDAGAACLLVTHSVAAAASGPTGCCGSRHRASSGIVNDTAQVAVNLTRGAA